MIKSTARLTDLSRPGEAERGQMADLGDIATTKPPPPPKKPSTQSFKVYQICWRSENKISCESV